MRYRYIFVLQHARIVAQDRDGLPICDIKELGVFSQRKKAEAAIAYFLDLPGFSDYRDDFRIIKARLYLGAQESRGMTYQVDHEYYIEEEDCDVITHLGYFTDYADAERCIEKMKNEPKFRKYPDGFGIGEGKVDELCPLWAQGFGSAV